MARAIQDKNYTETILVVLSSAPDIYQVKPKTLEEVSIFRKTVSDFWSTTDSIPSFCLNSVTRLRLLTHARVCNYSNTSAP